MKLRIAQPSDATMLRRWENMPHVIAATNEDDSDFDWDYELSRQVAWRELIVSHIDERPIGFMQIINAAKEETHYWGDVSPTLMAIDIWIGSESDIGKGYGTSMMHLGLSRCFSRPETEAVLVDPLSGNTRAHRFYARLGFREIEQRDFDGDLCTVYRIDREDFHDQSSI